MSQKVRTVEDEQTMSLWKLDEIPACKEGTVLAQVFLISCGRAVDRLGVEEPSDRLNDIKACYMALIEHGEDCDSCNNSKVLATGLG
jgi:hypothetical protein